MTALDLAAVCERHGIILLMHGGDVSDAQSQAADESYVCELLKKRYQIGTGTPCLARDSSRTPPPWLAAWWEKGNAAQTIKSDMGSTELAAVIALADRLRGAT